MQSIKEIFLLLEKDEVNYGIFSKIISNFKKKPTLDNLRNAIEQAKDVSVDWKFYTDSSKLNQFYGMLAKELGGIRGLIHLEPGTFQNRQVSFVATQKTQKSKNNPELMPQGQHVTQDFDPKKHRDIAQLQYDGGLLPDDLADEFGVDKSKKDELDPNPPSAELKEPPEKKYTYDKEPSQPLQKGVPGHPFNNNMKLKKPGDGKPLDISPENPATDKLGTKPNTVKTSTAGKSNAQYVSIPLDGSDPAIKWLLSLSRPKTVNNKKVFPYVIDRSSTDGGINIRYAPDGVNPKPKIPPKLIIDARWGDKYKLLSAWLTKNGTPLLTGKTNAPAKQNRKPASANAGKAGSEFGKSSFDSYSNTMKPTKKSKDSFDSYSQTMTASKDFKNKEIKMINEASMNVSMTGNTSQEVAELMALLRNAGMEDAKPVASMGMFQPEPSPCGCGAMHADGSSCGESVEEEWVNSPDEEYQDDSYMLNDLSGGINRKKDIAAIKVKDPSVTTETYVNKLRKSLEEKYFTELDIPKNPDSSAGSNMPTQKPPSMKGLPCPPGEGYSQESEQKLQKKLEMGFQDKERPWQYAAFMTKKLLKITDYCMPYADKAADALLDKIRQANGGEFPKKKGFLGGLFDDENVDDKQVEEMKSLAGINQKKKIVTTTEVNDLQTLAGL